MDSDEVISNLEKKSIKKIAILIPDGENYLLKSVVNGLAQIHGVTVFVMSNKKNTSMRYSRFIHKFIYYPKTDSDLDWIANINKEIEANDIDLVMPIWEVGIKILITHQNKILLKNKLGLLPALGEFNVANNKWFLFKLLESNNIPCPKSILLESEKQLDKTHSFHFPIVIKPLEGFGGGRGIRMFENRQDLQNHFIKNKFSFSYIVQEYIEGYDLSCSVLCKEGDILAFTMQKGNLTDDRKFAPSTGVEFMYEDDVYQNIQKLMKSLHWSGVANIDMRYDKNDKLFKIIEVNPRYWGSTEASILAGVNFPYLYCLASLYQPFIMPKYDFINYLSIKGLVKMIKLNKMFLLKMDFIFHYTPLKFALSDPCPMMYKLFKNDHN